VTQNPIAREEQIFHAARAISSRAEQSSYLDKACGQDAQLRARIEALLRAYTSDPSNDGIVPNAGGAAFDQFMQTVPSMIDEPIGTVISHYKLLERLGEGGFGVVYMAEQQHPVRRKVALKLIKPGLDTKQVIARFEAERQALALMEHENIARVFDAGATSTGRPYFVMELVRGVPITTYCDTNHLSPRQRLELFVRVCDAVQHAHSKGVIHRDIKPSNVLVTLHDGVAVPKVIDFGVAKAAGQQLTDRTLFTQFAQMVGTPLYMSPEQAEMSGLDVDTRSDVYSLGVLLYELLTGTTPLDTERLKLAAYDEVRRIIREEEPPRPSTRLSTVAQLATIASNRGVEPKKLGLIVRGELDWIVMTALEKDRRRRYETASGLARDVKRYLSDEPVEACPPSATYRLRKFARRNKLALLTVSALLVMLLSLVVGLAISNRIIAAERNDKTNALALAEAQKQRAEANFWKAAVAVRDTVTNIAGGSLPMPPETRERFTMVAKQFYQSLIDENSDDPSRRFETALGYRSIALLDSRQARAKEAEAGMTKAIEAFERLSIDYPDELEFVAELATTRSYFARILEHTGRKEQAVEHRKRAMEIYERVVAHGSPNRYVLEWSARLLSQEAISHAGAGRMEEFGKLFPRVINLAQRAEKAPRDFVKYPRNADFQRTSGHTFRLMAFDLQKLRLDEEAAKCLELAIRIFDEAHAEEPTVATHYRYAADTRRRLGEILLWRNRLPEAESILRDAMNRYQEVRKRWADQPFNPEGRAATHFALATLLANTGREKEAADMMAQGLKIDPSDYQRWLDAAGLFLAAGDHDAYRRTCAALLDRFTGEAVKNPYSASAISRTCALEVGAVSDFTRVEKMTHGIASALKDTGRHSTLVLSNALIECRAGRPERAIEWMKRYSLDSPGTTEPIAYLVLALGDAKLGRRQEAQAALVEAQKISSTRPQGRVSPQWLGWVHFTVLEREVKDLLSATPDSAPQP
jgi:eukaryotic-like serine/threonine-protein kinase